MTSLRDPHTCILKTLDPGGETSGDRVFQWASPQIEGLNPSARGGHTATLVTGGGGAKVIVFGGTFNGSADEGYLYLNDTFILDVDENVWQCPNTRGTAPTGRYGHSASLVGSRIVYFGGRGAGGKHFRDLHALDVQSLTWYQGPSSGGAPAGRMGHSSTLYHTNLFIFGGVCGNKYFNGLHVLDLSSMAWRTQDTSGPSPGPRMGHTAVLMDSNLVIHGGFHLNQNIMSQQSQQQQTKDNNKSNNQDDNDNAYSSLTNQVENVGELLESCYLSDFRILDLDNYVWSRLRTHGRSLTSRFGHSMMLSNNDLITFGGWNGQDNSQRATKGKQAGNLGDSDKLQSSSNCMMLSTKDMTWSEVMYSGEPPSHRYLHTCTAIGPHLIIFGGFDGGKSLADLIVLREVSGGE